MTSGSRMAKIAKESECPGEPGRGSTRGSATPCPECGQVGCAAMFEQLSLRSLEKPALYGRWHRLAVDAYCVQHEAYVKSAKSLAAHLCGLVVAFEYGGDAYCMRRLQQWLSANPALHRPELPKHRGALTIQHIQDIDDPAAYGRAVQEWARSAWEAYQDLHDLAR